MTVTGPSRSMVKADLDDMIALATHLESVEKAMTRHKGALERVWLNIPAEGDTLSPVTADTVNECFDSLRFGEESLAKIAGDAGSKGSDVRLSGSLYAAAEDISSVAFDALRTHYDALVSLGVLPGIALRMLSGDGLMEAAQDTLLYDPDLASSLVNVIDKAFPGSLQENMKQIAIAFLATHGSQAPVHVAQTSGPGKGKPLPPVRSFSQAAQVTEDLYAHGEPGNTERGRIRVQRSIDPKTGKGYWLVNVPGTQDWSPEATTPFDGVSNVMLAGGQQAASTKAVEEAIRQAQKAEGVYGKGEPVMMVGHSQGGMVVEQMIANCAKSREFNITTAATFGSPTGTAKVPSNVKMLTVRQKVDVVPQSDGWAEGGGNRTNVIIDNPQAANIAGGHSSVVQGHDMQQYANEIKGAATRPEGDKAIRDFSVESRPFYSGEARVYQFDAYRDPQPSKPHPPKHR